MSIAPSFTTAMAPFSRWRSPKLPKPHPRLQVPKNQTYDVAIVGAGWPGLFAAYFLTEEGKKVALLDKGHIGGEASGNSGGLILDQCEGDIRALAKTYGRELMARVLRISHDATHMINEVAKEQRFNAGYHNGGYIVGFRDGHEKRRYENTQRFLHGLVPDLFRPALPEIRPEGMGAPDYFRKGGVYVPAGGTFDPSLVVKGLQEVLKGRGVFISQGSEVTGFEAVKKRNVRISVKRPVGAYLDAKQVILAGGKTYKLAREFGDFPSPQPIMSAMVATPILSRDIIQAMVNGEGQEIPIIGLSDRAPYYRFTKKGKLLFGSGARVGKSAYRRIVGDIYKDLFKLFPALEERVDLRSGKKWGRELYYNDHELPYVAAIDLGARKFIETWPEEPQRNGDALLKNFSIIVISGLGGHGNNFGPYLGKAAALSIVGGKKGDEAYQDLRVFNEMEPSRSLTQAEAIRRLAKEHNP